MKFIHGRFIDLPCFAYGKSSGLRWVSYNQNQPIGVTYRQLVCFMIYFWHMWKSSFGFLVVFVFCFNVGKLSLFIFTSMSPPLKTWNHFLNPLKIHGWPLDRTGLDRVGPLILRFLLTDKYYSSAWSQWSLGCGPLWGSDVRSEPGGSAQAPALFKDKLFAVPSTDVIHVTGKGMLTWW